MAFKESFADQVKAQAGVWRAQIKEYQEQSEQAGAKARAEFAKVTAQLEAQAEQASQLFEKVQSANEGAWKDMQVASQKAFAELQKGWGDAISRFQ